MERLTVKEVLVGTTSREVLPSRPHCKMNGNKIGSKDKEGHECRQCFIIFSNERSMLRHNRKFHKEEYMQLLQKNNTVFLCYKCNQRFQSSAKLRQHNLSHGTDDKPFRCEICREGYSKFAELLTHRREVCPKRKFHCKVCGMNFQNLDSLETHKSIHLPRRRGRPAKKKANDWGTPDEETMSPEKEEEEEEEEEEEDEEEEEEELDGRVEHQRALWSQTSWTPDKETMVLKEVELDGRAEAQRAPWSQTSWTPDMKTTVPDEEEELDGRAEDQRESWSQTSGTPDKETMVLEEVELDGRAEDQRAPLSQTSWTAYMKTTVPDEEEELDGRAEDQGTLRAQTSSPQGLASESQQPGYNIPCPVDYCDLTFPSMEALRVHKKDVHRPQPATQSSSPEKQTMVPKEEKEEQEVDGRAEDQRALRAQTSSPQGCASESQLPTKRSQRTIEHGCPPKKMATLQWTTDMKTTVPKEEEEEEEVDDRSDAQRALRAHTSSPQGCASESQQPGYNIPCPVDNCDLTFPSVEALRVHKKDVHRSKPAPELAPPRLP